MFEAVSVTGGPADTDLQTAFRAMGYALYRLIGPDLLLVPFETGEALRPFDLNLFASKPDRARELARAGLLAMHAAPVDGVKNGSGAALIARQAYAAAFGTLNPRSDLYRSALDAYACWRDASADAERRYGALTAALHAAREAVRETRSAERLSSLARIAVEAGERQVAIDALLRAVTLLRQNAVSPTEPFLPASSRYDMIDPGNAPLPWLIAASVEAIEELRVFSGFFLPVEAQRLDILDWLQSTPFASASLERRRQLQKRRVGRQTRLDAPPILAREAPDNLNPELWIEGTIGLTR
jgi:tetratricopeptide (TPR) repeat protein